MLDLGVPAYMIRATVLGVMAQRLVRTLCPHCKVEEPVDKEAWSLLTKPFKVKPPQRFYPPTGCLECRDTGYLGRMGIYEILPMTAKVQSKIRGEVELDEIRSAGFEEGMRTLRLSGAQKVGSGLTTVAEILRVAPINPNSISLGECPPMWWNTPPS
jgi:general secretion pathway protein E